MTRVGTPTPDCHVERSRNISWKGNDVNCRKIVCLVNCAFGTSGETNTYSRHTYKRNVQLQRRNTSRNGGDRSERRAFVAHKLLLLQPQQVVVVRLGSLCSSSHTAKNFAFIFDMQALVRLFLPCGSPCVRSTSACAVLLRSRRTKRSGTAFSRFVLQTPHMPFVACNELAIATKSIASVLPH